MVPQLIADKGLREYTAAAAQVVRRHSSTRFLLIWLGL